MFMLTCDNLLNSIQLNPIGLTAASLAHKSASSRVEPPLVEYVELVALLTHLIHIEITLFSSKNKGEIE
jgi:hypothetical protein